MPTFGDCELAWTSVKRRSVKKYEVVYNGLIGKEKERFHPTQKPVELFRMVLSDYSADGEQIMDPFMGSGTTLIAAEMTARKCLGLEIDCGYIDVIVNRWQEFAGKEAILDAPGNPAYADVKADRSKPSRKRKRAAEAV